MCHCLECQRRTGGVISNQARFRREQVTFAGKATTWPLDREARLLGPGDDPIAWPFPLFDWLKKLGAAGGQRQPLVFCRQLSGGRVDG
jgi:hypothetical protein